MNELKPCPFCGKIPQDMSPFNWVACNNSKCLIRPETKLYASRKKAIAAWNKRK
jgi:hypothetical protein